MNYEEKYKVPVIKLIIVLVNTLDFCFLQGSIQRLELFVKVLI